MDRKTEIKYDIIKESFKNNCFCAYFFREGSQSAMRIIDVKVLKGVLMVKGMYSDNWQIVADADKIYIQ